MIEQVEALKAVLNAIPGFVSWITRDLVYLGVNEPLARAYGLHPDAFVGKPLNFLGYSGAFGDYVEAVFSAPEQQKTEVLPIRFPNTPEAYYSLSVSKYDEGRKAVVIGIDVSELKKAQAIIHDQQIQIATSSKMSALGEMAASVTHELSSPLATIGGFATQLRTLVGRDASFLSQEKFRLVDKIIHACGHARQTIDGFKRYARDGSYDAFTKAKMSDILDETMFLCREKFKVFQIALDVGPVPPGLTVQCRPSQVAQVLLNLFNNAIDAIGDQAGSGHEGEAWVKVTVEDAKDHVIVRVANNGPAIPAHLRDKILQPFFTTKPEGRGTGLGLNIARKIMQAHGGDLALDAHAPHVTFVLNFPKAA